MFLSGRFNSQNRLRESDFLKIFDQSGLQVSYVKSYIFQSDVEKMKQFKVAKRFVHKSLEDLAVNSSLVLGRKAPDQTRDTAYRRELIYQD